MKRQSRKLFSVVVAAILVTSMVGVGAADSTVSSTEQTQTNSEMEVSTTVEATTVVELDDSRADTETATDLTWTLDSFLSDLFDLFTEDPGSPNGSESEDDSPPADTGDDTGGEHADEDEEADDEDTADADETDSESSPEDATDETGVDDDETDVEAGEEEDTAPVSDDGDSSEDESEDAGPDPDEADDGDRDLDWDAVERYAHEAVNEERAAHGLEELEFDAELRNIARSHSQDMAERGYFSHEDPDGNGFTDRYDEAGYTYQTGGENIAQTWYDRSVTTDAGVVHYDDERELGYGIIEQWMNSEGHRENILSNQWENEGIGIYVTEDGQVYATQNFG